MTLQIAIAADDAGRIDFDALTREQDAACKNSSGWRPLGRRSSRRRATSFQLRDLSDHRRPGRHRPGQNLAADGQYFAIFDDGHHRQLPRLTGGPFRYKTFAADYLAQFKPYATKPLKQAVIPPSMLSLIYPLDGEVDGYTREQFIADLCDETEKDIRQASAAGGDLDSVHSADVDYLVQH